MSDLRISAARVVAMITVLLAVGALVGCADTISAPVGNGAIKVKADKKKIELKSDKGKLTVKGEAKSLPANWPAEMPIYKPSKLKSTLASEGLGEAPMAMAIFHTDAKAADVAAFYQANIPNSGWVVTNTVNMVDAAVTLTITKGNQIGSISVSSDQETSGTIISVNIAQR